jgi:hypothetical protein
MIASRYEYGIHGISPKRLFKGFRWPENEIAGKAKKDTSLLFSR